METINMQCKSISQIHSGIYAESCLSGRSVDSNLVEIHAEMSETLDK